MPKQIYMGTDDFADIRSKEDYLYVDKSLLVKEFIESEEKASLILRPRRFGKTLNLSMLHEFLSNRHGLAIGKPNLFTGLKISEDTAFCAAHQNKCPVIFISLKKLEALSKKELIAKVTLLITELFSEHAYLLPKITQGMKQRNNDAIELEKKFTALMRRQADQELFENSLGFLCQCLELYYNQKVIILIDEYDAVLNFVWRQYAKRKRIAHECGRELSGEEHEIWHNQIMEINTFIRHFLGAALKSNPHLAKGLMTGIYPMTKRDSASDLNNVQVFSFLDGQYREFFGFTEDELNWVMTSVEKRIEPSELKSWYNGYQVGVTNSCGVYNPWSVLTCLTRGIVAPYWEETGNHDLIREQVLEEGDKTVSEAVAKIAQGEAVPCKLNPFMNFENDAHGFEQVMSLLFYTGYLTVAEAINMAEYNYALRAPNQEIRNVYIHVIEEWLQQKLPSVRYEAFLINLLRGNVERFADELNEYLLQSISVFEATVEAHYSMFMAGLLIALRNTRDIYFNNIESGRGRPDTLIIPMDAHGSRGLILEYKCVTEKLKDDESLLENKLREKALAGLKQINRNHYEARARAFSHIHEVLEVGIAFHKKSVAVAVQTRLLSDDHLSDVALFLPNKPKEILSAAAAVGDDETISAFD